MPVYVYAVVDTDGSKRDHFEVRQRMSDDKLTHHPLTGEPVVRVPQVPNLVLNQAGRSSSSQEATDKLVGKGFTRYERSGSGYVKTGGPASAPDRIERPQ